jgi:hypothetical protein
MSIPRFELIKGFDTAAAGPTKDSQTFQAGSVQELLDATLTPTKVITSWGFGKTLPAALLAGAQGDTECMGENSSPLPTEPDKSLINTMVQVTYPSQAGRRT